MKKEKEATKKVHNTKKNKKNIKSASSVNKFTQAPSAVRLQHSHFRDIAYVTLREIIDFVVISFSSARKVQLL